MTNPLLTAQLRRNWQLVGAGLVFVIFFLAHVAVYAPNARRFHRAIQRATALGISTAFEETPRMVPPRVLALLSDNSLSPTEALEGGNSGALTAALLGDLTRITTKNGMEVVATEPGAVTQEATAVQIRAHLKINCTYGQYVSFLDELARGNMLVSIDRFNLTAGPSGRHVLDLWVTRYILKQTGPKA